MNTSEFTFDALQDLTCSNIDAADPNHAVYSIEHFGGTIEELRLKLEKEIRYGHGFPLILLLSAELYQKLFNPTYPHGHPTWHTCEKFFYTFVRKNTFDEKYDISFSAMDFSFTRNKQFYESAKFIYLDYLTGYKYKEVIYDTSSII